MREVKSTRVRFFLARGGGLETRWGGESASFPPVARTLFLSFLERVRLFPRRARSFFFL